MKKLQRQFFYTLEESIKSYRQFAQHHFRKKGIDITVDQWLVLKTLSENPGITQAALGQIVFKDKASITRILAILKHYQYVQKEPHTSDKRQHHLKITLKAEQLIKQLIPTVRRYRKKALQGIPTEDIETTRKVLKAIAENCTQTETIKL